MMAYTMAVRNSDTDNPKYNCIWCKDTGKKPHADTSRMVPCDQCDLGKQQYQDEQRSYASARADDPSEPTTLTFEEALALYDKHGDEIDKIWTSDESYTFYTAITEYHRRQLAKPQTDDNLKGGDESSEPDTRSGSGGEVNPTVHTKTATALAEAKKRDLDVLVRFSNSPGSFLDAVLLSKQYVLMEVILLDAVQIKDAQGKLQLATRGQAWAKSLGRDTIPPATHCIMSQDGKLGPLQINPTPLTKPAR